MLESSGAQVPTFDLQGASTANSEGSCISSRGARGDTTVTWEVGCASFVSLVRGMTIRSSLMISTSSDDPEADQGPAVQRQDHKASQLNVLTASEVSTGVVSLVRLYPR